MSIKIQYKGVNKKIVISSVNSYSQFLEKLKKSFNQLPQIFKTYFTKDEQKIWMADDKTFLQLKNDALSCKVFVVKSDDQEPADQSNISIITQYIKDEPKKSQIIKKPIPKKPIYDDLKSMKNINFLNAIYSLFDADIIQNDDEVLPWIKLQNITTEDHITVSQIWTASEALIKKMTQDEQQ